MDTETEQFTPAARGFVARLHRHLSRYLVSRYAVLIASIAMELCLGGIYAWSVFAVALRSDFGLSMTQAQSIFGMAIAVNTLAMVAGGRLLQRFSPRVVAAAGGVLLALGYIAASASGGNFTLLMLSLGLLLGIGLGYVMSARWRFASSCFLSTGGSLPAWLSQALAQDLSSSQARQITP
jgi:nitrate/nitrite transporter NarK